MPLGPTLRTMMEARSSGPRAFDILVSSIAAGTCRYEKTSVSLDSAWIFVNVPPGSGLKAAPSKLV